MELFTTIAVVAFFPPTLTTSPGTNPLPAIVMAVPPAEDPLEGDTEPTLGGPTGAA